MERDPGKPEDPRYDDNVKASVQARLQGSSTSGGYLPSFTEFPFLGRLIDRVLVYGAAIFLSSTSDGKSVSVTIRAGNGEIKDYPASQRDLVLLLEVLLEAFEDGTIEGLWGRRKAPQGRYDRRWTE